MATQSVVLSKEIRQRLTALVKKHGAPRVGQAVGMSRSWVYNVLNSGNISPNALDSCRTLDEKTLLRTLPRRSAAEEATEMSIGECALLLGISHSAVSHRIHYHGGTSARPGKKLNLGDGLYALRDKNNHWRMLVSSALMASAPGNTAPKRGRGRPPKGEAREPYASAGPASAAEPPADTLSAVEDAFEKAANALRSSNDLIEAWKPVVRAARAAVEGPTTFAEAYRGLTAAVQAVPSNLWPEAE